MRSARDDASNSIDKANSVRNSNNIVPYLVHNTLLAYIGDLELKMSSQTSVFFSKSNKKYHILYIGNCNIIMVVQNDPNFGRTGTVQIAMPISPYMAAPPSLNHG